MSNAKYAHKLKKKKENNSDSSGSDVAEHVSDDEELNMGDHSHDSDDSSCNSDSDKSVEIFDYENESFSSMVCSTHELIVI